MTEIEKSTALDPYEDPKTRDKVAIYSLILLLITFILGTLCLQGFNLVFDQIGKAVGAPNQASLITSLPIIVLGIVCFIYGSLGDFVSLRRLITIGLVTLFVGSLFGFIANFFFTPNLWTVIIARILQTAGEQVAGSSFLVIATKYLRNDLKVIFFGLFTAAYQLSASIGVFAAGALSSIAWQYLFLIPAITILFLPVLVKCLPTKNGIGGKIDKLGFTVFGVAVALLTLFFSYKAWGLLLGSIVLFIVFAVYIVKAKNPFVTPAFFKNKRWLSGIILIFIFYFTNYCMPPIYNVIGGALYHMSTEAVSSYLVWAFVVAAVFGTCSGAIIGIIGRKAGIITAAILMILGWVGAAVFINCGFLVLTLCACIYYAGCGLMYSPIVSTVLSALPVEESGRGCGMNDLVMNVTASIGISIFSGFFGGNLFKGFSFANISGLAAGYSNLIMMGAVVAIIGLVVYLVRSVMVK
ncbi:MFS transporter [Gardnerella vaginalis]|uniref:Transporter, major facilitator family protein n=1 Tax=Gardnerella vaginalis TaxID=2702 RepID=A0A133NM53_GARVA|nr:MFS transporter [Gardnerella vaginalis]KXA17363.1 transporter, major facilitator family protein [Gardnerella vaginalis]